MADDYFGPNARKYEYHKDFTEDDFRTCITNYFTWNLRHFKWLGFCNGNLRKKRRS